MKDIRVSLLFLSLIFTISGCGQKGSIPIKDINSAKLELLEARELNVTNTQFKLAQKYYQDIDLHIKKGDFEGAKFLAQKAYITAKLSKLREKSSLLKKRHKLLSSELRVLKEEFITITK